MIDFDGISHGETSLIVDSLLSKPEFGFNDLIGQVAKYDVMDFIIKLSALYALPENQSKAVVLDPLLHSLLTTALDYVERKPKMSHGKFRNIISALNNSSFSKLVDPIEYPFVQNVRFFNNYTVFNGKNGLASERLQNLINCCFTQENFLPDYLKQNISKIICGSLQLSDNLARNMNFTLDDSKQLETRELFVPSKDILEKISKYLVYDQREFHDTFKIPENYFTEIDKPSNKIAINTFDCEYPYYLKPFLKISNKIVLLNVTILPAFIFHSVLCMAKDENCVDDLICLYNKYGYNLMIRYIGKLGHNLMLSKEYDFSLISRDSYKEALFRIDEKTVLLSLYYGFGGKFSVDSMFGNNITFEHNNGFYNNRVESLVYSLNNIGIDNIYTIILVNSIGGHFSLMTFSSLLEIEPIVIELSDLQYIAINEQNNPNFLPYYMAAKQHYDFFASPFSELDIISHYKDREETYYASDDFDNKLVTLLMSGEYTLDYVMQAIRREKRMVIKSPFNQFCEVTAMRDSFSNSQIFIMDLPILKRVTMLNTFDNFSIWVYSEEVNKGDFAEIYFLLIDTITFWLNEFADIFNSHEFPSRQIFLELKLSGNIDDYFHQTAIEKKWCETALVQFDQEKLIFNLSPDSYALLGHSDNGKEKEMILFVLEKIFMLLALDLSNINAYVEKVFQYPYKKKTVILNRSLGSIRPVNIFKKAMIKQYDVDNLLDYVGEQLEKQGGMKNQNRLTNEEKATISRKVVEILFELLNSEISEYNKEELLIYALEQMEHCRYSLYFQKKCYAQKALCYPSEKSMFLKSINTESGLSLSLSFIIELINATPSNGVNQISLLEFNRMIAICNQIIEWAYLNDLFYYNLIDSDISFLNSGRIGIDKENINKLFELEQEAHAGMLKGNTHNQYGKIQKQLLEEFWDSLDNAFVSEAGCRLNKMLSIAIEIQRCAYDTTNIANKMRRDELIKLVLFKCGEDFTEQDIEITLNFLSQPNREDFLSPPPPYRKEDVYPWRFNRKLSLINKPLLTNENHLIWGNNSLAAWNHYIVDLLISNKYRAQSKELKCALGTISDRRGELFNDLIYDILCDKGFECYKNVKAINQKKITDDKNNILGDIDILYINRKKHSIIVVEVKDFKIARNNYELSQQNKEIFVDGKKPSYMTRHNNRVKWVEEHLSDLVMHYKLEQAKWTIKSQFVVNESMVSAAFLNNDKNFFTLNDIENL